MSIAIEGLEIGIWYYGDGYDINYDAISVDCWDSLTEAFGANGDYPIVVTSLRQLVQYLENDALWNHTIWQIASEQYADDMGAAEDSYWDHKIDLARGK
jgi:hypothetical protein